MPPDELVMLQREIAKDAFFERYFDRLLYGSDLKYAPARHLVKTIPTPTRIPKVKFVDMDGTLIQQQEWDRRVELSRLLYHLTKLERGDVYGQKFPKNHI